MIRFLIMVSLLCAILYFLATPSVDLLWVGGFGAACFLAIFLLTVSPMLTSHELHQGGIRLRQGLILNAFIPFTEIESVEKIETRLWAFGLLPVGSLGRIVLANDSRNLVSIKLTSRKRFAMLLGRSGKEIIIDLEDPGEFVKKANERLQR